MNEHQKLSPVFFDSSMNTVCVFVEVDAAFYFDFQKKLALEPLPLSFYA